MAYSYARPITINASLCGTGNSVAFPVFFAGGSYLATVANGGAVQSANGYDIGFYADSACTQALPYEMVVYSPTTGVGEWHVQVPTLSATTNTVIYVAYGDSTASTSRATPTSVWDGNYAAVYHLGTPTILSAADSTANANNGTVYGTSASTGKIGGAGSFAGSGSSYIDLGDAASLNITAALTVEAWINFPMPPTDGGYYDAVSKGFDGSSEPWALEYYGGEYQLESYSSQSGTSSVVYPGPPQMNVWYQWTASFDGSSTLSMYLDGALVSTAPFYGPFPKTSVNAAVGGLNMQGTVQRSFEGLIDEVRISNTARSASWITAQYNNQSSPATFYTLGTQITLSGNPIVVVSASALLYL